MQESLENPAGEVKRLQRCINDLVSVLAMPAIWTGSQRTQIVSTLLDSLLAMLGLDVAYARLKDPSGQAPIEMVRITPMQKLSASPQEIGEALNHWLGGDQQNWPPQTRKLIGGIDLSLVPLPLGLRGEIGVIVAGSRRTDFPQETDNLLLSVAANQAAIGLQEAWLLSEQKWVAKDLDQRVMQRNAALAAANEELKKEIVERRRAEDKLRQEEKELRRSETRNAAILGSSLDCIVTINHEGCITEFNPAAERTFGYRRDEVVGKHLADVIIPPSLREAHRQGLARYLATGEGRVLGKHVEMIGVRSDGSEIPVELAITRIPLDGPPSFTGFLRDITERKRAEEALRVRELNLNLIVNTIPTIAWSTRPDGYCEFVNQGWLNYAGLSEEQSQGWGWGSVIHPDDLNRLIEHWKSCLASGTPFDAEARIRRFDGIYRWFLFRANPLRDESGHIVRWFGINMDIEDRKHAEDKLRRSEAFLAEGQRLSRTGSFFWRLDTDEIIFSQELYRIFQLDDSEPISPQRIGSRVHPEDIPLLSEKIGRARGGSDDLEYEIRLKMPDGSIKFLHTMGHGTRNPDGQLEIIGAVQDVTERRLSEDALAKARSELAHLSRALSLGALTASIAHEVNQPLAGIVTNASTCLRMLAADPPNVDGARETARRTIRDGNRASEVITRLRALYSKEEVTSEAVDLNEATREVIALSLGELQRNSVMLRSELAGDLPLVWGDRVQLQQVIMNLLRNATDAMRGVEDRAKQLLVRTEQDENGSVRLTVQDSGLGFDPQAMDRLFEAFYTTKNDGMGMGLSVSRSIIESHRGRLWATLNDGPGSTFSFSIPCDSKRAPGAVRKAVAPDARQFMRGQ